MMSLLIISSDLNELNMYMQQLTQKEHIHELDVTTIKQEKSLGIEEIRNIQKKVFFKPLRSKQKAVVIYSADTLTIEAQNALLKILEEPPSNTYIILLAKTDTSFLPTIISRCKVIVLNQRLPDIPEETLLSTQQALQEIAANPLGVAFKKAQDLAKDKEQALRWLQIAIYVSRKHMLDKPNMQSVKQTALLQQAYTQAKETNINLRFLLEHTFMHLFDTI